MTLILASGSPRRRVLLALVVPDFDVVVPDVDETLPQGDLAAGLAAVASRKARAVAAGHPGAVVLAADTLVEKDGQVLGKARDADAARRMLESLQGRWHRALTAVAVVGNQQTAVVETRVRLDVPEDRLADYVASGMWQGKAGAYGAQDALLAPYVRIEGAWSNVVGLPLSETARLLREAGLPVHDPPAEDDLRLHNPFLDDDA